MRLLDRYLLRRGLLACLPLFLMFCLTGQALVESSGLAISLLWLPYLSLPAGDINIRRQIVLGSRWVA